VDYMYGHSEDYCVLLLNIDQEALFFVALSVGQILVLSMWLNVVCH